MNKYIHIASAALLATICTFLIHLTLKEQERTPFVVKATAQTENNSHFQLYYTETDAEPFSEEKMVNSTQKVTSSPVLIEFIIPAQHISKIRIDFDKYPKRVVLSPVTIIGDETKTYNSDQYNEFYFIDSSTPSPNGNTVFYSDKEDPMIVFHNVNMDSTSHTFSYYLYLTSAFILFIALFFWLIHYLQKIAKKIDWHNALFVATFFLLLLIPISHISKETKSESENRMLANKPTVQGMADLDNYGKAFDSWLNDHFAGRRELLSIHSQFYTLEGGKSPNSFEGKGNWFFFSKDNSLRNFANIDTFSTNELVNIANYFESLNHWCESHGKKFYLMINPDKSKVYGEHYRYVNKIYPDSKSRTIQTVNYLRKHTNVTCVYTLDSLIKAKETGQLIYYKDDTHWTHYGAYVGYRDIMHCIQKDFDVPIVDMDTFFSYHSPGDLAKGIPSSKIDTSILPSCPVLQGPEPIIDPKEGADYHTIQSDRKYSLLTLGDSFTRYFTLAAAHSFGETTQIRIPSVYFLSEEDKKYILESTHADCIVMVMVERMLVNFVN